MLKQLCREPVNPNKIKDRFKLEESIRMFDKIICSIESRRSTSCSVPELGMASPLENEWARRMPLMSFPTSACDASAIGMLWVMYEIRPNEDFAML